MSRRDDAIVAWHEVPGAAEPQRSRPVGYGMIRAGVRTDSMIGVTNFLEKHGVYFDEIPSGLAAPDHTVPYGTRRAMLDRPVVWFPTRFHPFRDSI
jgi:hypothetical protein